MNRRRFILLIVIMAGTSTIVGGVTILKLYRGELENQRNRLIELVQSQARLIEAVGQFDARHSRVDHVDGASGATLGQIKAAHRTYVGFGKTGEFTLAQRDGDRIVFLLSRRFDRDAEREPIPFNSELAEPMQRALSGKSGWVIGVDYRGETVLAAHEPVRGMNWGIVAKIDLAEIRAPFIRTAAAILGVSSVLVLGGAFLFLYFTNPLMKQLEKSRQRFARAVQGTSDGLWEWNIRTNEFWRAPRCSELLDYADGELAPTFEAWESRVHPEDRARATEALRLHLEQNQPYDVEFRLRAKSGDYRWFRGRGQAERHENGKPIRMAGSIQDITERKQAEAALQESEERFRSLFENAPLGYQSLDQAGRFVDVNDTWCSVMGYAKDEVIGKNFSDFLAPEYIEKFLYAFPCFQDAGEIRGIEFEMLKKDGSRIIMSVDGKIGRHPDGSFKRTHCILHDIAERKRAEQELRLSEARTRAIVDHAADGIITIDERGIIESFNKAAENIFGYAADEVIDENISVLMPSPYSEEQDGHLERYLDSGVKKFVGMRREVLGWRKDGSTFPLDLHVSEVQHNGCRVFTGIVRDLTNRKQLEQERINCLQLEQERNHLRDAVQAHEKVLGVVGHELRTPLASVRAMAEFLLKAEARGTAEADTFLQSIHDEVIRMVGMVNDLLEVARMNSGASRWNWSEIRLAEACEAAMESMRHLIDPVKMQFLLEVRPRNLTMKGDVDALRRLVLNLLNNANKHTSEGWICVRAIGKSIDNHSWVELQVRDTGEGMPPEIAERLGMPFTLNSGIVGESHVQGSGLGLAICRGIAAAHGGAISVETAPGEGTSVTILMRADLPEAESGREPTEITYKVQQ